MKEEMSDFLKFAIKSGRIKDVEEAFKEFPPEEEWHKGRIENVSKEESKEYNSYKVGEVTLDKIEEYKKYYTEI